MAKHSNHHDEHSAYAPPVTLYQSEIGAGVDNEHEHEDIDIPGTLKAFGWLTAVTVASFLLVYFVFNEVTGDKHRRAVQATPLTLQQPEPPYPRLLPNPFDERARKDDGPLVGPIEYRELQDQRDHERLARLGLYDPGTGLMTIPEPIIQRVAKGETHEGELELGPDGLRQGQPGDAAGGLKVDDLLR